MSYYYQTHNPTTSSPRGLLGSKSTREVAKFPGAGGEVEKKVSCVFLSCSLWRTPELQGRLVCKASQWFMWFVAGFTKSNNNNSRRWDTLSAEACTEWKAEEQVIFPATVFMAGIELQLINIKYHGKACTKPDLTRRGETCRSSNSKSRSLNVQWHVWGWTTVGLRAFYLRWQFLSAKGPVE